MHWKKKKVISSITMLTLLWQSGTSPQHFQGRTVCMFVYMLCGVCHGSLEKQKQ